MGGRSQERLSIHSALLQLQAQEEAQRWEKPNADHIRSLWERFTELWDYLTDEERERTLQLLVERVDIQTKTEGTCRIRISTQLPSANVGLTEGYTPRGGLEPPTFRLTAERSAIELAGTTVAHVETYSSLRKCGNMVAQIVCFCQDPGADILDGKLIVRVHWNSM